MRKYLFLFCLFFICIAINAQSSSEYKYLYFGGADEAPKSYVRINKDPVVLTFIKEIEAIRLTWEGDDLTFYIKDAFQISKNESFFNTVQKGSNMKAVFYLVDHAFFITLGGKYVYLITNTPKPEH